MTRIPIESRGDESGEVEGTHHSSRAEHPFRRRIGRGADKLLTLDRALLVGIFTAGAWYATTDLRAGNVHERVRELERRQEQIMEQRTQTAINYATEYATTSAQLKEQDRRMARVEENLAKLAEATARLANSIKDQQ